MQRVISSVLHRALIFSGTVIVAGCASGPPAAVVDLSLDSGVQRTAATPSGHTEVASGNYRVQRGDTLYAIAFKHGLDYRDLAAWNAIASPYRIFAGQDLRLTAPAAGQATTQGLAEHPVPAMPQNPHVENGVAPSKQPPPQVGFQNVPETPPIAPAPPPVTPPPVVAVTPPPVVVAPPKPVAVEAPATTAKPSGEIAELNAGGVNWRWPCDGKIIATFVNGDQIRQGIDIAGKAGDPVVAAADGEVVYSGNGLIGYGELIIIKHNASYLSAYGHNRKRLVKEGDRVKAGQQIAEMGSSSASRDELHFEIRKNGKPVNPIDYLPVR
jgi:lipoprotein NlpD